MISTSCSKWQFVFQLILAVFIQEFEKASDAMSPSILKSMLRKWRENTVQVTCFTTGSFSGVNAIWILFCWLRNIWFPKRHVQNDCCVLSGQKRKNCVCVLSISTAFPSILDNVLKISETFMDYISKSQEVRCVSEVLPGHFLFLCKNVKLFSFLVVSRSQSPKFSGQFNMWISHIVKCPRG